MKRPALFAVTLALLAAGPAAASPVAPAPVEDARTGASASGTLDFRSHGVRLDRRTRIAASASPTVTVGSRVIVSGVVRVRAGRRAAARPVALMERTGSRWADVARKRTTRTGSFRFVTPAFEDATTLTFRVAAPRSAGLAAARSGLLKVQVLAPEPTPPAAPDEPTVPSVIPEEPTTSPVTPEEPAPLGEPDDWSYLFGEGSRWNPCTDIRWAYNPRGGYTGALADVQQTYDRISARTGLRFEYVGTTSHVEGTGTTFPTYADMAIGWATEATLPDLKGSVVGVGGGSARRAPAGSDVAYQLTRGYVVLDGGHALSPGFAESGPVTWGQVMTHEVLHALGLGHARTAQQVMYGSSSATNHLFGAGDVTGMSRIGATQGCL